MRRVESERTLRIQTESKIWRKKRENIEKEKKIECR